MKEIGQVQKKQAYQIVKSQAVFVSLLFIALFGLFGIERAGAALTGGMVALGANLLCVSRMFRATHDFMPQQVLGRFYGAQLLKIVTTLVGFVVCLKYLPLEPLFLLVGYAAAQVGFWMMPLFSRKAKKIELNDFDNDAEQLS